MKSGIHPEFQDTVFKCACGAEIHTRSLKEEFRMEICSNCHPFFTGKQKLVDSAGRVERFLKKYAVSSVSTGKAPVKGAKKPVKKLQPKPAVKPRAKKEKPASDKK